MMSQVTKFARQAHLSRQASDADGPFDRRTDVYALGVLLYQSLTGVLPFAAPTRAALFHAILEGVALHPGRINTLLHADLAAVCLKAIERQRERRYASAAAFADDLARVRAGEPTVARPPSTASLVWRRVVRRRALLAVIGLLIASAALAVSLRRDRREAVSDFGKDVTAYTIVLDAWAKGSDPDPEALRRVHAYFDPARLESIQVAVISDPEARAGLTLEFIAGATTAHRSGDRVVPLAPLGTVVESLPEFAFKPRSGDASTWRLEVYDREFALAWRETIPPAALGADGIVRFRPPAHRALAAGKNRPGPWAWHVKDATRGAAADLDFESWPFAVVTPEWRDTLLAAVKPGLPADLETLLRATLLIEQEMAADALTELEKLGPSGGAEVRAAGNRLAASAHAILGRRDLVQAWLDANDPSSRR